jgi:hypothetical protein
METSFLIGVADGNVERTGKRKSRKGGGPGYLTDIVVFKLTYGRF